jgi:hypothetical protein
VETEEGTIISIPNTYITVECPLRVEGHRAERVGPQRVRKNEKKMPRDGATIFSDLIGKLDVSAADAEHLAVPWADALVMFDAALEITLSTIRPENGRAIRGYGCPAFLPRCLGTTPGAVLGSKGGEPRLCCKLSSNR